jgi:hypothetical protein
MKSRKEHQSAGDWVCVRTRYGWEFEGKLLLSDTDGVRVFDPVIDEVVRLAPDDVIELAHADTSSAEGED